MTRNFWLSSLSALALLGLSQVVGCGTDQQDDAATAERLAVLAACGLNDGTVSVRDDLRACDPQDTKKTTICHIPPGNPANAHTLCIGNPAVAAHLRNHGDSLGACVVETPCPPPRSDAGGGAPGSGGAPGGGETPAADAGVPIVP
jgi:hypothetical protein